MSTAPPAELGDGTVGSVARGWQAVQGAHSVFLVWSHPFVRYVPWGQALHALQTVSWLDEQGVDP